MKLHIASTLTKRAGSLEARITALPSELSCSKAVRSLVGGVHERDARDALEMVRTLRLMHELRRETVVC